MTLRSATHHLLRVFKGGIDSAIFEYEGLLPANTIRSLRAEEAAKARKIIEEEQGKGRIVRLSKLFVNWEAILWRRPF